MSELSFQAIAAQQGWSHESQASILLTFIDSNGPSLTSRLAAHAHRAAAIENGDEAPQTSPSTINSAHADEILAELVDQLDGIGIPDWAGAEGLSLESARQFLATQAHLVRADRAYAAALRAITWDEADFPYEEWQQDVANGDTRRSYAEWVLHNREQASEPGSDPS